MAVIEKANGRCTQRSSSLSCTVRAFMVSPSCGLLPSTTLARVQSSCFVRIFLTISMNMRSGAILTGVRLTQSSAEVWILWGTLLFYHRFAGISIPLTARRAVWKDIRSWWLPAPTRGYGGPLTSIAVIVSCLWPAAWQGLAPLPLAIARHRRGKGRKKKKKKKTLTTACAHFTGTSLGKHASFSSLLALVRCPPGTGGQDSKHCRQFCWICSRRWRVMCKIRW